MKKILLGIFIVLLMSGCEKDEFIENNKTEDEIKLNINIEVATKAPINNNFNTNLSIGVYAVDNQWKAGQQANWINNDSAIVTGTVGHAVTFSQGSYYYPSNGNTLTFYAFAPFARETTASGVGTSPLVTHYITGHEDVMWAKTTGQKGNSNPANNPSLTFIHKLTQLQFTFKADSIYPTGYKVISLKVRSQPSSVVMNVETGICTFFGSNDMEALSAFDQASGIPITEVGTNALSPVMTKVQTGSSAYFLDIVVQPLLGNNIIYSNVPIDVNASEGNINMIILTFKSPSSFPIGISPPVIQS